jgi:hypothetical protein
MTNFNFKSKAIPVTGREGLWGCQMSRMPYFLDGGVVVSLTRLPHFSPQEHIIVFISVKG